MSLSSATIFAFHASCSPLLAGYTASAPVGPLIPLIPRFAYTFFTLLGDSQSDERSEPSREPLQSRALQRSSHTGLATIRIFYGVANLCLYDAFWGVASWGGVTRDYGGVSSCLIWECAIALLGREKHVWQARSIWEDQNGMLLNLCKIAKFVKASDFYGMCIL